jgi:cytochrome c oxidase cbb3-type subunit 2
MSILEKHKKLERNSIILLLGIIVVVIIGGLIEVVPLFRLETDVKSVGGVRPLTPLELAGQNIYIREGCVSCHSQQIRPLRDEVTRYGHYSLAAESMYDHPFLWGSERTGPDLARVGGKYSDEWQTAHLKNPRDVVPESIMPSYSFLARNHAWLDDMGDHLKALRAVGVPYTDEMIEQAANDAKAQGQGDTVPKDGLLQRYGQKINARDFDGDSSYVSEMDALIAYLQTLGAMVDFKDGQAVEGAKK